MPTPISINQRHLENLDLSPVSHLLQSWLDSGQLFAHEQSLQFQIDYPQPAEQAVELPEIPEVRLWFIRLDSVYPWLPYLLDWRSGEVVRYAAMLVPHEFRPREGIQFNPQALDLFLMQKVFVIEHWLAQQGQQGTQKLQQMAEMFGYDLNNELFELLAQHPA